MDPSQQQQQSLEAQMAGMTIGTQTQQQQQPHHPRQYPQADLFNVAPMPQRAPAQQPQPQWRPQGTFPVTPVMPQSPSTAAPAPQTMAAAEEPPKPRTKIDPNQMPNPTTTSGGESASTPEIYATRGPNNSPVSLPPPPSTRPNVTVRDMGNCSPRYMRSTAYAVPSTSEVLRTVGAPLGVVVCPLADVPGSNPDEVPPLVDSGTEGPVRCHRCRAYVNPFVAFGSGGTTYSCRMCGCRNDVPDHFFSPLEPDGRRADIAVRPELTRGSVEYSVGACKKYMPADGKPLLKPAVCFVVDVSEQSIASGLVSLAAGCIKQSLAAGWPNVPVGFVTYNSAVHFWDMSSVPPRMLVVPDVESVFVPAARGLFVDYSKSAAAGDASVAAVDHFAEKITAIAQQQTQNHRLGPSSLVAAVQGAALAMASKGYGGKIVVFHASMPVGNPGALRMRDNPQLYGTDKERSLIAPQSAVYRTVAAQCAAAKVGVDSFLCCRDYADVATIGELSRLTGGQVYYYGGFDVARDAWRLESELRRNLSRPMGFDASFRVRVSAGLTVDSYLGHVAPMADDTFDVDLPIVDSEKALGVILKHDDRIDEAREVIIQAALLFTTFAGERRVRVHTMALPATSQLPSIFKSLDCDAIVGILAREAIGTIRSGTIASSVAASVSDRIVECLAAYRRHCTTSASSGQLILPESVRLLPLHTLSMMKLPLLRGEVAPDPRVTSMLSFESEPVATTLTRLYPRVWALHSLLQRGMAGAEDLPQTVRLSLDFISTSGVYLVDDGARLFVWAGAQAPAEVLTALFGTADVATMTPAALTQAFSSTLQQSGSAGEPSAVYTLIGAIAQQRMHSHFSINCVAQAAETPNSALLAMMQLEDKQAGAMSYVDYLCHVHRQIQLKLS